MFDKFVAAADRAIRHTSTDHAPWQIVEGEDERYRSVAVGTALRDGIRRALERVPAGPRRMPRKMARASKGLDPALERLERDFNVLDKLDMTQTLDPARFAEALERQQGRLNLLQRKALASGVSTILVFEGWDAAGKGGAIRRITGALDARDYQVIPISAPTDEEKARHYLWRFWRHLSRAGRITIFDRSWYGRVLVERVEGFATEDEYRRGYGEINHFEEQLIVARHPARQVLDSHHEGRAAAAFPRAQAHRVQALEDHARGLAQPRPLGRLHAGGERDGRADEHAGRAVDARRGERQELHAHQGAEDAGRSDGEATQEVVSAFRRT